MIHPTFWGLDRKSICQSLTDGQTKLIPEPRSLYSLSPELAVCWTSPQVRVSRGFSCRPLSAAQATFSLISWPGFRGDERQLVWNRKTINLFKLLAWPICLTFSTVMNENVDNRMFHKTDNSKRLRKTQNKEVGNLFLLLKSNILQNFLTFFFFLPLSSVTHSPVQPRYFGVFFSGKPVGGWIWRSQELTKYQQMLEPPKQRQTPPPTQGSFEKDCWSAPTWADFPVLMRGISKSSSGAQAVRAAFLRTPPALCEAEHGLWSQAYLVGSIPDPPLNPNQLSTIWEAGTEFLKLSGPVSSSVPEMAVPASSHLLQLNKLICIKSLLHCHTPDRCRIS